MIMSVDWMRFVVLQIMFWGAGAVFSAPLEKREKFGIKSVCFLGIVLLYSALFIGFIWDGNILTEYLCRAVSTALLILFLHSGWKVRWSIAVYNAIWATVLWQLLLEVWSVIEYMGRNYFTEHPMMIPAGTLLLYTVNYIIVAKTIGTWMPKDRKDMIGPRQLSSAVLIFAIIQVLGFSQELRHISEYTSEWKFLYISQMLAICILYMQNELFKKSAIKQELAMMNLLWKNKQEQYEISKENIDLINQKSHDLKHQIRALRKLGKEEFDHYMDEIEDSIAVYETIVKTGNDVFDTILTEKSLYCKKHEINVSCVADGSQMDFIEAIDLYAILGNAMDNAIEAVQKFSEPEKRQIDVIIHRQQNFLMMNFINPMPGEIEYEGDFPVTTKGDRQYHGFGLRSIRHFVKKYDGFMNITVEDGCFSLKIMMPVPNNAT